MQVYSFLGEVADMELAIVSGRGPDVLTNIGGLKPLVRDEDIVLQYFLSTIRILTLVCKCGWIYLMPMFSCGWCDSCWCIINFRADSTISSSSGVRILTFTPHSIAASFNN